MAEERLQKVMAAAGVASRRKCEEMILAGRVQVNGHSVTELGAKVDADQVQIQVDGQLVRQPERKLYIKLHKPRGILSDIGGDSRGRQTVVDLLPEDLRRVFAVGRLDLPSEGLILLTDDGKLANQLSHPRYEHPKVYYVLVEKMPTQQALEQLRQGVEIVTGRTAPCQVQAVDGLPSGIRLAPGPGAGVWLEIILREGKKRQVRHMTAAVGHPTLRLIRWSIGSLTLEGLGPGEFKNLSRAEVGALQRMVSGQEVPYARNPPKDKRRFPTQLESKRRSGFKSEGNRGTRTQPEDSRGSQTRPGGRSGSQAQSGGKRRPGSQSEGNRRPGTQSRRRP